MSVIVEHEMRVSQLKQATLEKKATMDENLQRKLEERRQKKLALGTGLAHPVQQESEHDSSADDVLVLVDDPVSMSTTVVSTAVSGRVSAGCSPSGAEQSSAPGLAGETPSPKVSQLGNNRTEQPTGEAAMEPDGMVHSDSKIAVFASPIPSAELSGSTPRTATRDLLNIDLDTWLARGSSQDIFDCAQTHSCASGIQQSVDSAGVFSHVPANRGAGLRDTKGFRFESRVLSSQSVPRPKKAGATVRALHRAPWGWASGGRDLYNSNVPVDRLRVAGSGNGYSRAMNQIMARVEADTIHDKMSKLRAHNYQLKAEKLSFAESLERERKEWREEQDDMILQLEESVRVSCALRVQLAAAQEEVAAHKLQIELERNSRQSLLHDNPLDHTKVQGESLQGPEVPSNTGLSAAVRDLMIQNRDLVLLTRH
jgi:hypothetical protein